MFSSIMRGGGAGSGSPSSTARATRAASTKQNAASARASPRSGWASQIRISTVGYARCGRTLHQSCVCSSIEPVSYRRRTYPSNSAQRAVRVGDAAAREHAGEDLRARRVEAAVHALDERRAGREGEQVREEGAQAVVDGDGAVGAADADVDVQAEGVVPPDDVAQELVVAAVVRRVDDPLVLPAAPRDGCRSRRARRRAHAASAESCARRSPIFSDASAKVSQRPVRTSTSEAISSPTRCSSSGRPAAAAFSSSKRLTSESVSGSSSANSSSTARVRSVPSS